MGLRLLVALGLFLCILTGWFTAHSTLALLRAPAAPLRTTVADAPDQRWVELEDAALDCSTQQVRQRTVLVVGGDRAGGHPFVAQLAGRDGCAQAGLRPLDGAFIGSFSRDFLRQRQSLRLPPGEDLRVFSQSQAPRFLRRSLGWRIAWFALSLLLTGLAARALWTGQPVLESSPAKKSGRRRDRG
jgi:DNA gyrase/topoisomerase IV subunit B